MKKQQVNEGVPVAEPTVGLPAPISAEERRIFAKIPHANETRNILRTALDALKPILDAADQADSLGWRSDNDHPDYNENAHLGVTITVKEARAVRDAIRAILIALPKDGVQLWVPMIGEIVTIVEHTYPPFVGKTVKVHDTTPTFSDRGWYVSFICDGDGGGCPQTFLRPATNEEKAAFALGARSKPTKEAVPAPRGTGAKRSAKRTGGTSPQRPKAKK